MMWSAPDTDNMLATSFADIGARLYNNDKIVKQISLVINIPWSRHSALARNRHNIFRGIWFYDYRMIS